MASEYTPDYVSYIYAIFVLFGGLIGYVKAHSLPSLIVGVVAGILLLYGGYLTSIKEKRPGLSIGIAILLAAIMSYRFILTRRFMPGGFIALISFGQLVRLSFLK